MEKCANSAKSLPLVICGVFKARKENEKRFINDEYSVTAITILETRCYNMAELLRKTVLNSLLKKSGCSVVRQFSSSRRVASPRRDSTNEQTKKKYRTTRKKISELPEMLGKDEGGLQISLGEWDGGIPSKTLNGWFSFLG